MDAPKVHEDVYDPTTDPRHKPATELPGPDPDAPRPKDPSGQVPPPGREAPAPVTPPPDRPDHPS